MISTERGGIACRADQAVGWLRPEVFAAGVKRDYNRHSVGSAPWVARWRAGGLCGFGGARCQAWL